MSDNFFAKNFDYGSILPFVLFIIGMYINYSIIVSDYHIAFFVMMIAFLVYIANNVYINWMGFSTIFNEYLEDMASFVTFGLSTIIFGIKFYDTDAFIIYFIMFYSVAAVLSFARAWVLRTKNTIGWPLPLNGIFFPLIYYIYEFFLQGLGGSIFLFFYVIVAILMVSEINFLGFNEDSREKFLDLNKRVLKQKVGKKKYEDIVLNPISIEEEKDQENENRELTKNINNEKLDNKEKSVQLDNNVKELLNPEKTESKNNEEKPNITKNNYLDDDLIIDDDFELDLENLDFK
jgi:hypothetical protein